MRISWIEYEGKKILFEDYSNLLTDDCLKVLYQSEIELKKLSTPTLILLDFTNAFVDQKFFNEIKRIGKQYGNLIEKSANVGVEGIQKIFAVGYNKFTGQGHKNKYFNTLQEAKAFLVK